MKVKKEFEHLDTERGKRVKVCADKRLCHRVEKPSIKAIQLANKIL
jgi:hypothetical protein